MWSRTDNILVVSTLKSTRFYSLVNIEHETLNELDQDSFAGFSEEPTLAISNMASVVLPTNGHTGPPRYDDSRYVVQVTSTRVLLVNLFTGMRDSIWRGEADIVAASANPSQVVVALKGGMLVILAVRDSKLIELRSVSMLICYFLLSMIFG